jgi:hypothetical protein
MPEKHLRREIGQNETERRLYTMNESETRVSEHEIDFVPTCRWLDHCELILHEDGCRTCEFRRGLSPDNDVQTIESE